MSEGSAWPTELQVRYLQIATSIATLVASKQEQYGDSFGRSGDVLRILYPEGVRPDQMDDVLTIARMVDKMFRIAQRGPDGGDKGGEDPERDLCGYALLAIARREAKLAEDAEEEKDLPSAARR